MSEKASEITTACPVAIQAEISPKAVALIAGNVSCSYSEYEALITTKQATLSARGVSKGARVIMNMPAAAEYCVTLWALFRLCATACPVNPALPQKNMDDILALLKPHWRMQKEGLFQMSETRRGFPPFCATIVMTSGSSGAPKAAAHTIENHIAAARAANRNMPLAPGDRWLLSLPLYHVAGLAVLFRCAVAGAAVVVPESGMTLENSVVDLCPTHISLVPTQLYRLLESSRAIDALSAMKGILLGGAPASRQLITKAFDAGLPLICSYGMTETTAQLCATTPGASLEELFSSGRPLTAGTLRIGKDGIIEVTSETLFAGYYMNGVCRQPDMADGWFRTGDTGFLDDAGCLHVTGRADAMFISGGENIQPAEIEAALYALPKVRHAIVVPVPDMEYGAVPVAFVDMGKSPVLDDTALHTLLAARLPRFKIPRHFFLWPEEFPHGMKQTRDAFIKEAARRVSCK